MKDQGKAHVVHEKLHNPLTLARDEADRAKLRILFHDLSDCPDRTFLALRPYITRCPERFFDLTSHTLMIDWLNERDTRQRGELQKYFARTDTELSRSMHYLRQINEEDWHDNTPATGDDFDLFRFIDRRMHPAYLRLVEGVFAALIRPVAYFSRLDRHKNTEGLDVFNIVQEVATTPMAPCIAPYRHLVRNGIGHGGITYMPTAIRYRDKMGHEETIDAYAVIRLCDDMLDTCNGLASALKVFLIRSRDKGYRLPRELLIEELIQETRTPWWSIEGCVESEIGNNRQLVVYARPNSRDFVKIQFASLQSAVLAERFAPGYDRYFFSLRTSKATSGWAAFDGKKLRRSRESGAAEIADYAAAFEKPGLFYIPRPSLPRFLGRIDTLRHSLSLQWPLALEQIRENLGIPKIISRYARLHRNGWRSVLNGTVVIECLTDKSAAGTIRAQRRRILRRAAAQARLSMSRLDPLRYLPLGFARIAVFSKDFRRRRLSNFGLECELVCTVQLQRIRRIKSPHLMGSTIESNGNWTIAWNRAWIESGGRVQAE